MDPDFTDYLLKVTNSTECGEVEIIQALWSGYGRISRYQLDKSSSDTVVVKYISLNQDKDHPRGWNTNFGHQRKVKSYKVETNWYEQWSQLCTENCRVPGVVGSFSDGSDQWIILEDLNKEFPLRKNYVQLSEIKVCLKWLANFHATFLNHKPDGLWEVGTYWHLNTRPDEFKKLEHSELKSKAHAIDEKLNGCKYLTIVHGDAKLANFCFSENGEKVAAVDFQYVGGGCGMKDVAYFLGSCLSSSDLEFYQNELLDYYFSELAHSLDFMNSDIDFRELENEWRKMYFIAWTDFTRFLLGWMPSHQKLNNYSFKIMKMVLARL